MSKVTKKPAFEMKFKSHKGFKEVNDPAKRNLRVWQNELANVINDAEKQHVMVIAPTGSGKSLGIIYNISLDLTENSNKKVIVATPSKAIGMGFSDETEMTGDLGTFDWLVSSSLNLCSKNLSAKSKTSTIIEFLKDEYVETLSERICLCSHQTLVRMYQYLKRNKQLHLLKDVVLWVDECHHSNSNEDDTNHLGRVVNFCLENDDTYNIKVGVATATPFRGDKNPIIKKEHEDKFTRYSLPYDRHFSEICNGLSFKYDILLHESDWFYPLGKMFKESDNKTLVFIPVPNSRFSTGNKQYEVQRVIEEFAGRKNPKLTVDEHGIISVKVRGKVKRIADVVDDTNTELRTEICEYIRNNPDEIDLVIGMKVPKEGFDWTAATRAVIVGGKDSMNELMQMMGRTFRYHKTKEKGKTPVEIVQLFPWVDKKKLDETKYFNQINEFYKVVYGTLILECMYETINVDIKTTKTNDSDPVSSWSILDALGEEMSDTEAITFIESVVEDVVYFSHQNDNKTNEEIEKECKDIIKDKLKSYGLEKYEDAIAEHIMKIFKRRTKKTMQAVEEDKRVKNLDIILAYKDHPIGFVVAYGSGIVGAKDLRKFRFLLQANDRKWDENYLATADWLVENNKEYFGDADFRDENEEFVTYCQEHGLFEKHGVKV